MSAAKLFDQNDETIYSLEFAHERLSICREFMSDNALVVKDTIPSLAHHLTEKVKSLTSAFQTLADKSKPLVNFFIIDNIEKKIDRLNFINLSSVLILTPEGFKGLLTEYGDALNQIYPILTEKGYSFSNEFRNALAYLVTNKEAKTTSKSFGDLIEGYKNLRTDAVRVFEPFNDGSSNTRTPLGNVVKDKKDLSALMMQGQELAAAIKGTNIQKYKSDISEITELLEEFRKQIGLQPDMKLSPQIIQLVSTGTYELAAYYEYLSVMIYKAEVFTHVVDDLKILIEKNS